MNIRNRSIALVGALAVSAAACGGGSGASEAQTEDGAAEAAIAVSQGFLDGEAGPILDHLSAECRADVDDDDVKAMVALLRVFLADEEFDIGDIELDATVTALDGDAATVEVTYTDPGGADTSVLGDGDEMDLVYEDGKWVLEGCDFGDTSEADADALDSALEATGFAGTRDEPIPAGVGLAVSDGLSLSIDSVDPDAAAAIEAAGGYEQNLEAGETLVMVAMTFGYTGDDEPSSISGLDIQVVGDSSTGSTVGSCGSIPTELSLYSTDLFSGGVVSGDVCFTVADSDVDSLLVSVGRFGADTTVFFDPGSPAATPAPVTGASGPQPDGSLTGARTAPIALGTATDLGEGWTMSVNGADTDATASIMDEYEYNDEPPAGSVYVLVDVTLAFDGDEPASPSQVSLGTVGDSNVGYDQCFATVPEPLDAFADLFQGGSATGNVCFVVPEDQVASLLLYATVNFGDDTEVFALS